jgi:D-alanine transaminase
MPELAGVNGKISAPEDAVVPIDDRGVLFGDAVYEALRVYSGKPFSLDRHQARFRRSLSELGITGVDVDKVSRDILDLIAKSGLKDSIVYYQASRGVHPRDHVPPANLTPTVIITVRAYRQSALLNFERGVSVVTVQDIRWGRVDIKTTNLLPNCLAKMQAKKAGCYEAILVDGDVVREACSTAALLVNKGTIIAPRQGPWILPSITREICEELAREDRIPIQEREVKLPEFLAADELFLMGSSTEVVGIVQVDGRPVGGGKPGPVTKRLHELYRAYAARSLGLPVEAIR